MGEIWGQGIGKRGGKDVLRAGQLGEKQTPRAASTKPSALSQPRARCFVIYKRESESHSVICCRFTSQKDLCFLTQNVLSHGLTPFKKGTWRKELDTLRPAFQTSL